MQARLQKPYNDGSCHFNYFKVGFFKSDLFGRRLWRRRPTWRQSSLSSHLICSRWIVPNWFEFGVCHCLCCVLICVFFHIGCCLHRVFITHNLSFMLQCVFALIGINTLGNVGFDSQSFFTGIINGKVWKMA